MTRSAGPGDPSSSSSSFPGLSRLPVPFPVVIRFYELPISTEEQLALPHQLCWLKSKGRRTPGRPVRGPHDDAQREDPMSSSARTSGCPTRGLRTPSGRTPRCPARGSHDTQQESPCPHDIPPSWIRPKSSPRILRGTLDTDTDTCPQDPPTVNPSTATGTPCTFPVGHAGAKTLDPGLPLSRETHLLTDELR